MIVHKRDQYLRSIARNIRQMGIKTHWQIVMNQPSRAVLSELNAIEQDLPLQVTVDIKEAPFSPLEHGRERWPEFRQWQLERLPETNYGVIWDDDHLLADPTVVEPLLRQEPDLAYITKLFFWGTPVTYTTHIPTHRSVFFFRRVEGERFHQHRILHAPLPIHDEAARIVDVPTQLLDYGYMDTRDRERCWLDYKRAGKIDAATLAIVRRPCLQEWKGPVPLIGYRND